MNLRTRAVVEVESLEVYSSDFQVGKKWSCFPEWGLDRRQNIWGEMLTFILDMLNLMSPRDIYSESFSVFDLGKSRRQRGRGS